MHLLGQGKNMSVALVDHVGADLFAVARKDPTKRYAISVKGRVVPQNESKNYTFDSKNVQSLSHTAQLFGMEPAVAFVFVDEQEGTRKIRMMFATLRNLDRLAANATFIDGDRNAGYVVRWTEGRNCHYLSEDFKGDNRKRWSKLIDYTELSFDIFERDIDF